MNVKKKKNAIKLYINARYNMRAEYDRSLPIGRNDIAPKCDYARATCIGYPVIGIYYMMYLLYLYATL